MKKEFAIRLQDIILRLPVKRQLPHRTQRTVNQQSAKPILIGGRLNFDHGSSGTVTALDGVSITIVNQEKIGVIGHNGAGKTSLLKIIAGIYFPTSGRLETKGNISTLFSNSSGVNLEATGLENTLLCGLTLGMSRKDIKDRIPDIIEFSELGDYMYMPMRTYSAGMRARLLFAISTCTRPDIFLMDEVIGIADGRFHMKAKERLNLLMSSANVLMLASHSIEVIRDFCSKVIWLEHGRIRKFGSVEDVLREYASPHRNTN